MDVAILQEGTIFNLFPSSLRVSSTVGHKDSSRGSRFNLNLMGIRWRFALSRTIDGGQIFDRNEIALIENGRYNSDIYFDRNVMKAKSSKPDQNLEILSNFN
jgi:hypothetical protein